MMKTFSIVFVSLSLALVGCKKTEDAAAAAAETPSAKPAEVKVKYQKLGDTGLEAEIPEDATVTDNTKGAGFLSATIYASPTTFVSGPGDLTDVKATLDETKAELAKDPNKLKSFTREEKTADGWVIEVARESMVDQKPLYGVSMRRTIDGKAWDCGTNADSKEEIAKVIKLCQSLRASK